MNPLHSGFKKLRPAVRKEMLLFLSGAMWIAVGILLNITAAGWLNAVQMNRALSLSGFGLAAALLIAHFGFLRVVDKNLGRISLMEGKRCVFSFMSWKSYLTVMFMISLGIGLRHTPIPKPFLAIPYIAIGSALMLSSLRYFKILSMEIKGARSSKQSD